MTESREERAVAERSTLDLLLPVAARGRAILRFTVLMAVLSSVVAWLLPNEYTARVVLLPPAPNNSMALLVSNQLATAQAAGAAFNLRNPAETTLALLRSRGLEEAVVERYGLDARYGKRRRSDTCLELEKRMEITLGARDGLLRLSLRDRDARLAAEMANGYVEEFRKYSSRLALGEAAQRRLFFEQQLAAARQRLGEAEEAMKQMQQQTGVLQVDSQARLLLESAASLRAQIVARQVQIEGMRAWATEDNPEVIAARQQLSALEAQLARLGGAGGEPSGLLMGRGQAPEAGLEYMRRYREVKYAEAIYELMGKQYEMARLDEAKQGSVVQVADAAMVPDKKSGPPRLLIVLLATLAALLLGCCWALAGEMLESEDNRERVERFRRQLAER